jgi:hypothetical protein
MSENLEVSWVAVIDTAKKIAEVKIEPIEQRTRDAADILASWDGVFNV